MREKECCSAVIV